MESHRFPVDDLIIQGYRHLYRNKWLDFRHPHCLKRPCRIMGDRCLHCKQCFLSIVIAEEE